MSNKLPVPIPGHSPCFQQQDLDTLLAFLFFLFHTAGALQSGYTSHPISEFFFLSNRAGGPLSWKIQDYYMVRDSININ